MFRLSTLVTVSVAIVGSAALAATATAQSVADFYKGKTINIVVGAGEGGEFDVYARTLARYFPKYMPGSPSVIVQNRPGAGSINAANYVYSVAPQDGTVMAAISGSAPMLQIMGEAGPQFDSLKFQWVGNLASDNPAFYLWATSPVKKFDDAFTKTAILGSFGPNGSEIYPALTNNVLGTKFKVIQGYKSGPAMRLAMEAGELEGAAQTFESVKSVSPEWITSGRLNVIAQIGLRPDPEMTKMGVPMLMDFVTREHVLPQYTVEQAQAYFKLALVGDDLARPYAAGPGVPKDRFMALKKAFEDTANDAEFVAESKKAGRPIGLIKSEEIVKTLAEIAATPKDILSKTKDLIKYQGEPK